MTSFILGFTQTPPLILFMLPVFVINLASSESRRNKITKRLAALDISFELFEAVDGRNKVHPLFSHYNNERCQQHRRTCMAGGELGCFASHYLLWQKCVELGAPIVVMEDDVYVCDNFTKALDVAHSVVAELGYVRLAGTSLHRRPYKVLGQLDGFDLLDHVRGPSGTLCYMIAPEAAQTLLSQADCWYLAVDDYMDSYWLHGVDCYSLFPYPVLVADNGSDIARNDKAKRSLLSKAQLEVLRRTERARRNVYRMRKQGQKRKQLKAALQLAASKGISTKGFS